MRERWVTGNPAQIAKAPTVARAARDEHRRWSPTDLARFRAEADKYADGERFAREPWIASGMRLSLAGLRRSEVLGLDWRSVEIFAV